MPVAGASWNTRPHPDTAPEQLPLLPPFRVVPITPPAAVTTTPPTGRAPVVEVEKRNSEVSCQPPLPVGDSLNTTPHPSYNVQPSLVSPPSSVTPYMFPAESKVSLELGYVPVMPP